MKVTQDYVGTTLDAVDEAVTVNVAGCDVIGFQITGTFTATITIEASMNGTDFVAFAITNVGANTANSAFTAPCLLRSGFGLTLGIEQIRARMSAYTSGSALVIWQTARSSK